MRSWLRALAITILAGAACHKASGPTPDCNNHIADSNETDIDCGGSMCSACGTGKKCKVDRDCISLLCNSDGVCSAPSCSDGIKNGSESDTDCGGPDCAPCNIGKMCFGDNDCTTFLCGPDAGLCEDTDAGR